MVYLQWQKKDGKLVKEVVWPDAAKSSELVYPMTTKYGEEAKGKAKETAEEKQAQEKPKSTPGFEVALAIAGISVAYLLRRKL